MMEDSEQICEGATFKDLDPKAIKVMKEKYAKRQNNPSFVSLDDRTEGKRNYMYYKIGKGEEKGEENDK